MAHRGTLILQDEHGVERSVPCGGGLDTYAATDGGLRVRGVVNVSGEALEEAREIMERAQGGGRTVARYSGQIYTVDRRDERVVNDLPLRIEGIDETGNLRVESDEIPAG